MSALPSIKAKTPSETDQQQSVDIYKAIEQNQIVIEFDPDGNILTANSNFLTLFGYSPEDLAGKHHSQLCPPGAAESEEYKTLWTDLRAGKYKHGEFMRLNRQGRPVWLQATYTPILNADGKPYKIIKFASDITGAKLTALSNEGKVAAISRSQGIIEFDLTGSVLDANENFLQLMGYTLHEIKGQHHRIFVDKDEANSGAYRAFWQKLGEGEFYSGEYLRLGKNGKRIWIQATYNPILDLHGKPVRVVKYCSDITAAKLLAMEMAARMEAVSNSS
ncbi:MAG: PAS domain-containing protein, partial [Betaproteobacteria bacterium]|nr:PAS domain-containing protein [Betaproteobacteria bacterium]